jgi:hypothetical protein
MLNGVGLAQEFWVKVVDAIKYLVNISPSSALVNSTTHEVWFGKNHLFLLRFKLLLGFFLFH